MENYTQIEIEHSHTTSRRGPLAPPSAKKMYSRTIPDQM